MDSIVVKGLPLQPHRQVVQVQAGHTAMSSAIPPEQASQVAPPAACCYIGTANTLDTTSIAARTVCLQTAMLLSIPYNWQPEVLVLLLLQVMTDGMHDQLVASGLKYQMQCQHSFTMLWTVAETTALT